MYFWLTINPSFPMKPTITILLLLAFGVLATAGCKKSTSEEPIAPEKLQVFKVDAPFRTDKYLRIGYTLKTWEFAKDGLSLQQILVLDNTTKAILMTIEKADLPKIHKDPLPVNPWFANDTLHCYYLSIQLPIPLGNTAPTAVTHRFVFQDTVRNQPVTIEGGTFVRDAIYRSLVISSPVKGSNWVFINQSTLGYHFNTMFFVGGKIGTGERYAFDNLQIDSAGAVYSGDPTVNESYYNYKDTLYAVADGIVKLIQDGHPENNGNAHNVTFNKANDLAGNYLVLDIGSGKYAFYCHCVPGSFMVQVGHVVHEGDPIALLGNSGNSDCPHLHFQITDSEELFMTNGQPFMLKKYTKTAEFPTPVTPVVITNAMMEGNTVMSFD